MDNSGAVILFIVFVIAMMVLCKFASNAIGGISDHMKDVKDRAAGKYEESKPQNLRDRFK